MENYKNSKIGLETAQKYGDIIEMERPQTEESLRKHPRMTLQNRAKIFSPFSPLRGYDEQLAAEKQRTERVPKRILTEEEMSALSDRLMQVTKGMTITVRYFKEDTAHPEVPAVGNYITLTGKADRIDPVFRSTAGGSSTNPDYQKTPVDALSAWLTSPSCWNAMVVPVRTRFATSTAAPDKPSQRRDLLEVSFCAIGFSPS